MNFKDWVKNKNTQQSLMSALNSGKLPHSIILEGGDSQQRLALSKFIANTLVCSGKSERPCGHCDNCVKFNAGFHPDVMEIEGGESARSFHVDKIRDLRRDVYILPNEAERKVYILVNAHSMSVQAQNAILKTLEEPPKFVSFILLCESKGSLLTTVLSRSTVFGLGDASFENEDEKTLEAKKVAGEIALAACGSNEYELMKKTAAFEKDKELFELCLSELKLVFRDALVIKYRGKPISCASDEALKLSQRYTEKKLLSMIETVGMIFDNVQKNSNHNLLITSLCYKLWQ